MNLMAYLFIVRYGISVYYRFNKLDKNSDDLLQAEKEVDQYKDVLEKISKKFLPNTTSAENRTKKVHEYRLGQTMEDSAKDLQDGLLKDILTACGKLQYMYYMEQLIEWHYIQNTHIFHT